MAHRDDIVFTTVGCQPIDRTGCDGGTRTPDLTFSRISGPLDARSNRLSYIAKLVNRIAGSTRTELNSLLACTSFSQDTPCELGGQSYPDTPGVHRVRGDHPERFAPQHKTGRIILLATLFPVALEEL
jgi:hypothetical protein